ncbi:MAG: type II toxin-antitoxin system HicB family antitoxin [Candidatus Xenobia bacterium]
MKYLVLIEKTENNYGAWVPDLPGCVATGETEAEVQKLIQEAIELHIRGMVEDGDPVPSPSTTSISVEVA